MTKTCRRSLFSYLIYYKTSQGTNRVLDVSGYEKSAYAGLLPKDYILIRKNIVATLYTVDKLPPPSERHQYFMLTNSKYTANDEGLIGYEELFHQWNYDLHKGVELPTMLKIKGKHYYRYNIEGGIRQFNNNFGAVECIFLRLKDEDTFKKATRKTITPIEDEWFTATNMGGLLYCDPGTYKKCTTLDHSGFYMNMLNSKELKIPISEGVEKILKKLPKKIEDIKLGIYRVKILCEDKEFSKIFNYSKKNAYTNYSLEQAYKYKDDYDIKIELFDDGLPNFLYYEKYITGNELFGTFCRVMNVFKQKYPSNRLIKHISSSLWGTLSKKVEKFVSQEDVESGAFQCSYDDDGDNEWVIQNFTGTKNGGGYFKLRNVNSPYKYNLRLKSFLTSYGRNVCSELVMLDIKNVIRVNTDGVTFTSEQDADDVMLEFGLRYNIREEKDKSGYMTFYNNLRYKKHNDDGSIKIEGSDDQCEDANMYEDDELEI